MTTNFQQNKRLPPPPLPPPFLRSLSSPAEARETKGSALLEPLIISNGSMSSGNATTTRRRGPATSANIVSTIGAAANKNKEIHSHRSSKKKGDLKRSMDVPLAVSIWFLLGVLSIATTKILLLHSAVRPLWLSVQQFALGGTYLHLLLKYRIMNSNGKQPIPNFIRSERESGASSDPLMELLLTALFFGSGFVATNYSFQGGSASFVETVKASEPITSAIVAVTNGVDTVTLDEGISLLGVVFGVLISTVGTSFFHSSSESGAPLEDSSSTSTFLIAMLSNLCFSFRGLHQKLLRSSNSGSSLDDMNLQYRIQWISAFIFILPALFFDFPEMTKQLWRDMSTEGLRFSGAAQYVGLSVINGFAFASYNLASTYVLTRLTVVHHATLNCVRRIFAIIVTSILFHNSIGALGLMGILTSFISFMFYTRFKVQRQQKPRPVSSLLPMSAA